MTVYRPGKSPYFHFDFRLKGKRYHGSTGVDTRRAAEAIERKIRLQAASGELDDASRLTWDQAAARWWDEVGRALKGGDRLESRIERAITLIGPALPLGDTTTSTLSRAIERRRGQARTHAAGKAAKQYLPSASTVNRDMIDAVRPIWNRARKVWGATLPEIDWKSLRLAEPKPKPKEFAGDDLDQLLAQVRPHWHDLIRFAAVYGLRLSELFFALDDVDVSDLNAGRIRLRDRKGDDDHTIPLLPADAAAMAARLGRARAGHLTTVWFRERRLPGPGGQVVLKPLTAAGLAIAVRRAMTRSGLRARKGMRGIHAARHHAGMSILRATGNLRVAQRLLGHADIKSTLVYAHAIETDVRLGLAALPRNSPEPPADTPPEAVADQSSKAS